MSQTEHIKGKLKPFRHDLPLNLQMNLAVAESGKGKDLYESFEDLKDHFEDECYEKFYIYKENVYKIETDETFNEWDYIFLSKCSGDDFEFEIRFYNGGCSFNEALDEAMKNLTDK